MEHMKVTTPAVAAARSGHSALPYTDIPPDVLAVGSHAAVHRPIAGSPRRSG